MARLTQKNIAKITKEGLTSDDSCTGLYLRFAPPNSRTWVLRTRVAGKVKNIGLGSTSLVTLAEAREQAHALRKIARTGGDPLAQRRAEREALTFEEAARRCHEARKASWKSEKTARVWMQRLTRYAFPVIGAERIDALASGDVLKVLTPIWHDKRETARKVREYMRTVFDWAISNNHYSDANPVDATSGGLTSDRQEVQSLESMPWQEVPALMTQLHGVETVSARLLEFTILTGSRSTPVRHMRWADIDLDSEGGALWIAPSEHMKSRKDFRVPLPPEAIAILDRVRGLDALLVFPSPVAKKGSRDARPLSDATARKLLQKDLGHTGVTVHGFRTSLRTWIQERQPQVSHEVAETMIAHATGSRVSRAYARSDLLDQRRPVAEAWARYVTGKSADVVELVRA
ncbi:site-specific integrase [Thalassobius sp. Cn5-15]|uniref:tyrosine-type recombinase/integrase n=1 Tax=Thalassobius sp. Cn5-15 TaxID=2917763 RepID=UPI001EF22B03|nr:site-specific integrase [Thalassobius sp. Cn5-15]MCG7494709.1 integrase arm-type DNA-binding domain-containing protein [Thalassobius sp. Cn5-15]